MYKPTDSSCCVIKHKTLINPLTQCFSIAGPWPVTGLWRQLYPAARGSPGICHFNFSNHFL